MIQTGLKEDKERCQLSHSILLYRLSDRIQRVIDISDAAATAIAVGIELGIEVVIAEGIALGIELGNELGIALEIDVDLPEGSAVGAETTATKADSEHVRWLEQPKRISTLSQTVEVLTYDITTKYE